VENTFWTALATSTLAALVTALGIYTIRRFADWGHRNTPYFMCFAAGVSDLGIVPAHHSQILFDEFAGAGLAARWVLRHAPVQPLRDGVRLREGSGAGRTTSSASCRCSASGCTPSSMASSTQSRSRVSILTGYLATMGMVLHEFPEGIITYLLLVKGGIGERKAVVLAFLAAAATTPLGMLVSWPLISAIEKSTLGALLALSAGALVYVGATHLLPRAEQEKRKFSLVALAGGVLVAVVIVASKA
jgi:zinc and cadmium transporter